MATRNQLLALAGLVLLLAAAGGIWMGFARIKDKPVKVPILMYHRVGHGMDSPWWVAKQDFESHLRGLRGQGYESVLPSDLAAHQRWGWPLPAKPVMITFDDGYRNVLEDAEPLLKQYGFRAVCYLITGLVADTPETRKSWEGTPLLTWPEVRAMQARGTVVFGGHSRSHANLRAMADPSGEISGCYRDLRKKGKFRPEGFCYPSGQYKDETMACVARARFSTAVTCDDGIAEIAGRDNLLALPRVSVMGGVHGFHVVSLDGGGGGLRWRWRRPGGPSKCPPG